MTVHFKFDIDVCKPTLIPKSYKLSKEKFFLQENDKNKSIFKQKKYLKWLKNFFFANHTRTIKNLYKRFKNVLVLPLYFFVPRIKPFVFQTMKAIEIVFIRFVFKANWKVWFTLKPALCVCEKLSHVADKTAIANQEKISYNCQDKLNYIISYFSYFIPYVWLNWIFKVWLNVFLCHSFIEGSWCFSYTGK